MIQAIKADITTLYVDAIVNAANESLLGGGGVDGAIHQAAGPLMLAECRTLNCCQPGDAKITDAYSLPCRKVIHAVGPRWYGGDRNEAHTLRSCYMRALQLAYLHECRTIAFPCISTGIFGYPKQEAARIAIESIQDWASIYLIEKTIFCCFSTSDLEIYQQLLTEIPNE